MFKTGELDAILAKIPVEERNSKTCWEKVLKIHRENVEKEADELLGWIQQELSKTNHLQDILYLSEYSDETEENATEKVKIKIGYSNGGQYTQKIFDAEVMRLVVKKLNQKGYKAKMFYPIYPDIYITVIIAK